MMPAPRPGQERTGLAALDQGRCAAFSTSCSAAKSKESGSEKTGLLSRVKPCGKDAQRGVVAPARDCSNGAGHGAVAVRNRLHFSHIARGSMLGLAWPLAPTCGRSGAAGDAERGRSLCHSRAGLRHPGPSRNAASLALPLPRPVWHVRKLARQLARQCGSGVAVLAGTARELGQYHKIVVCECLSHSSGSSKADPSRHARGRARMRTPARVYARGLNFWNSHAIIPINHELKGSVEGSVRVLGGSGQNCARSGVLIGGREWLEPNILAGGNAARPFSCCRSIGAGCIRGVMRGLGGESFRVFGLAAGDLGGAAIEGRNGGFLRFPGGRSAHVGTIMLEGLAYPAGMAALSGLPRLPVRLTAQTPPGGASAARGGGRPQARARSPRSLAHHVNRIWIGVRGRSVLPTCALRCRVAGNSRPTFGSGCERRSMLGNRGGAGGMAAALNRCGLVTMNRGR
jgi:hypothetical protein